MRRHSEVSIASYLFVAAVCSCDEDEDEVKSRNMFDMTYSRPNLESFTLTILRLVQVASSDILLLFAHLQQQQQQQHTTIPFLQDRNVSKRSQNPGTSNRPSKERYLLFQTVFENNDVLERTKCARYHVATVLAATGSEEFFFYGLKIHLHDWEVGSIALAWVVHPEGSSS